MDEDAQPAQEPAPSSSAKEADDLTFNPSTNEVELPRFPEESDPLRVSAAGRVRDGLSVCSFRRWLTASITVILVHVLLMTAYHHVHVIFSIGLFLGVAGVGFLLLAKSAASGAYTWLSHAGNILEGRVFNTVDNWKMQPVRSALESGFWLAAVITVQVHFNNFLAALEIGTVAGCVICLGGEFVCLQLRHRFPSGEEAKREQPDPLILFALFTFLGAHSVYTILRRSVAAGSGALAISLLMLSGIGIIGLLRLCLSCRSTRKALLIWNSRLHHKNVRVNWETDSLRSLVELGTLTSVTWVSYNRLHSIMGSLFLGLLAAGLLSLCIEQLDGFLSYLFRRVQSRSARVVEKGENDLVLRRCTFLALGFSAVYSHVTLWILYSSTKTVFATALLAVVTGLVMLLLGKLAAGWQPTAAAAAILQGRFLDTGANWRRKPLRSALEAYFGFCSVLIMHAFCGSFQQAVKLGTVAGLLIILGGEAISRSLASAGGSSSNQKLDSGTAGRTGRKRWPLLQLGAVTAALAVTAFSLLAPSSPDATVRKFLQLTVFGSGCLGLAAMLRENAGEDFGLALAKVLLTWLGTPTSSTHGELGSACMRCDDLVWERIATNLLNDWEELTALRSTCKQAQEATDRLLASSGLRGWLRWGPRPGFGLQLLACVPEVLLPLACCRRRRHAPANAFASIRTATSLRQASPPWTRSLPLGPGDLIQEWLFSSPGGEQIAVGNMLRILKVLPHRGGGAAAVDAPLQQPCVLPHWKHSLTLCALLPLEAANGDDKEEVNTTSKPFASAGRLGGSFLPAISKDPLARYRRLGPVEVSVRETCWNGREKIFSSILTSQVGKAHLTVGSVQHSLEGALLSLNLHDAVLRQLSVPADSQTSADLAPSRNEGRAFSSACRRLRHSVAGTARSWATWLEQSER